MNNNKYLLDCTLRDGGYVNDWNFGKHQIASTFNRLAESKIDFIEIGFLDERVEATDYRSIQPNTEELCKLFTKKKKHVSKILAMIDYGTCDISNIQKKDETTIDGIRLIFKKPKVDSALEFAKQLMDLGYDVFLQMVSITSYSDRELLDFIEKVNKLPPFAVSIVDTYGLLHKEDLLHYFHILDYNLDSRIALGYHSHNNFQLGYSNSIEFLNRKTNRDLLVDGTVYGMGKSAGNAPLELLAMHLNEKYEKTYDIGQILETIDVEIMKEYQKKYWGYSLQYFLSASNDCHPNYVSYLLNKKTLSVNSINTILSKIPTDDKLNYNLNCIEKLYIEYQSSNTHVDERLKKFKEYLKNKKIVLIGPGASIKNNYDLIKKITDDPDKIVFHINCLHKKFRSNYIFVSNSKRYSGLLDEIESAISKSDIKIISTSNITPVGHDFDYILNYEDMMNSNLDITDNSLIQILDFLKTTYVKEVTLCGFDGYDPHNPNYYEDYLEYNTSPEQMMKINDSIKKYISTMDETIKIVFATPSKYT